MTKSLKKIALIVSLGTLASKLGGFARQLLIAGVFGVGAAYDAYNYAYIVPGFFLILLGGINGPFHNSMVSVLSRTSQREKGYILSSITTIVSIGLLIITLILFFNAEQVIRIVGPGLNSQVHDIAVYQLKIMSPIVLLAGLIGLGFGALNASNEFLAPSISPLISSLTLIIFIIFFRLEINSADSSLNPIIEGGFILAIASLIGALLQWTFQLPYLVKNSLSKIKFILDWKHPKIKEVLKILGPASFSAGMLQINVFTDLFFASGISGAAAGLSYANFLIQAPLGLISNALLIPLLPTYAKLSTNEDQRALIKRIRQGLMFSTASMIALGAIFICLGHPIVELVYQRGEFNNNASNLVTGLLIAYGIGMPTYLCRDLLVRIFYSLGESKIPFIVSSIGILLNILFDWISIGAPTTSGNLLRFNYGAQGLVISTGIVNLICCLFLLYYLNKRISGMPILNWIKDIIKLLITGLFSGASIIIVRSVIIWPSNPIGLILEIASSVIVSFFIFSLIGNQLKIKEINDLQEIIFSKFHFQ